jgi:16S rRNA processing protein RimM
MGDESTPLIEIGAVASPFGVRGWVKIRSFTEPPERLFEHRAVNVGRGGTSAVYTIESTGRSGGRLTAKFAGVDDRDRARALCGAGIFVSRAELPQRATSDFYRADLIGCEVFELGGKRLGILQHFVETPAHALMVVKGDREFWVPAVPQHLRRVDLDSRRITVAWDDAAE